MKINVHYRARCESAHSAYSVLRKGAEYNVPSPFKRRPRDVDLRFLEYFGGYGYGVIISTLFEKFHELRTYQERRNTSVWNSVLEMSLRNMVMRDIILA